MLSSTSKTLAYHSQHGAVPHSERKRHRGVEAQKEQEEERFLLTGSHHGQKVTASAGTQSLCPHPVVKDFILHRASPVWALWSPD